MNPFDLRGPQFLLFYALFAAVVLVAVRLGRRRGDPDGIPSRIDDPYLLAALRDGPREAIRVALLSLADRRLVKAVAGQVEACAAPDLARRPIERALMRLFRTRRPATDAFDDPEVRACTDALDAELLRAGLVAEAPGAATAAARLGSLALVVVAGIKVAVALSRGRSNLGFLVALTVVAGFGALSVGARPRRTRRGDKAVELAQRAFVRLKYAAGSLVPGGQTNELALAFAVFGIGALPPLARDLLSEARLLRSPGGGSSCGGSSCGSSSCGGSSCGGGCGGGGCGGCGS